MYGLYGWIKKTINTFSIKPSDVKHQASGSWVMLLRPILVGVFEEKARLLHWLVFFVSLTQSVRFFVHLFNFLAKRLTRILVRI